MATKREKIFIDREDRPLYDKIEKDNMFKGKSNKEKFMFAMSIGVKNEVKLPLDNKDSGGYFWLKDVRREDEALMNAVAMLEEKSASVLSDKDNVYKIAEEYAHVGIKILADKIESIQYGNFYKQFEGELHELYDTLFGKEDEKVDNDG